MKNYINGGVIKNITIFYKNNKDFLKILSEIGNNIDINLFDLEIKDNMIDLSIKEEIIENNFIELLYEIKVKGLFPYPSIDESIKTLEKRSNKSLDEVIKECDDIFIDRFYLNNITNLENPYYDIEIQYYNLFFNGPFSSNNYKGILNHLASLNKYALDNILKDAICYGIN